MLSTVVLCLEFEDGTLSSPLEIQNVKHWKSVFSSRQIDFCDKEILNMRSCLPHPTYSPELLPLSGLHHIT